MKKIFQDSFIPKIMILPFLRMTDKSLQFAAKIVLMNRQENLMIFSNTLLGTCSQVESLVKHLISEILN